MDRAVVVVVRDGIVPAVIEETHGMRGLVRKEVRLVRGAVPVEPRLVDVEAADVVAAWIRGAEGQTPGGGRQAHVMMTAVVTVPGVVPLRRGHVVEHDVGPLIDG